MLFKATKKPKTCALLLTGGGARAAYQVGVLKAISSKLPRNQKSPFKVISGTSAGAINAVSMACYASCFHLGVKKTEWVWKNFRTEQVYASTWRGVFGHLALNYLSKFSKKGKQRATSLFDNRPLRNLLQEVIDYKRIDRNILSDHLDAVSVAASSYNNGDSIAFFQSSSAQDWSRAKRKGVKTMLSTRHLMASAAIPLVFPSVKIDEHYYGDGSIHQLSPLSPSIHLGADKILIIGVEHPEKDDVLGDPEFFPNSATITGHLLDTVFTDSLNSDLERLNRINSTLEHVPESKTDLKPVHTLLINPSRNFSHIASNYYDQIPSAIRFLLKLIGVNRNSESTLMSYILFEKPFTKKLIEIGYEDGLARLDEIMAFLELEETTQTD
ncbi:patatin-like phospholipase family protein [Psychrosphaera sp. B3R10]|uniref:patatin-like phospholipase family protein n=1 Tax=unclassified Psychrosphaera TaxID=2641570 RepID=UPI001C0821BD|nr:MULTISPECIES: patatin-like phospholipase family protein [unclassified Psychrosphaera]MBU2881970.1 patatin-like phospholipase family protein [Psychrosphaera sp. I2R16]MBU2988323.1 patatin-like phospholipase family protein [Psychrosphaera sp. B3R10]MDO6718533.1 patatin-like phospholipase family protein [Psychrosphaera sp. 1_MG-2023]